MVVTWHRLIRFGAHHHNAHQIAYKQAKQEREPHYAVRQALPQRNASKNAVRADGGSCVAHFLTNTSAFIARFQQEAHRHKTCQQRRSALADKGKCEAR